MNTMDNYLPVLREANGRWYWPPSSSIGTLIAIALLAVAIAYAHHYPTMKTDEATQRLERFNSLTMQTLQGTQTAVARLQTLSAGQPEWLRNLTSEQIRNLNARLALIKPLNKGEVLEQAQAEQKKYDQAQQLIEGSPFKGLTVKQVPLSIEGKAYLDALEIQRPSRFDYQRLSDGVIRALPVLQAGFKLQAEAENLTHQVDVQLNGEKAMPLGVAATTALQAPIDQLPEQLSEDRVEATPGNTLTNALRQAERTAAQQQRQAELDVENQQRQAAQEAHQAELLAQRKQQQAQRAAKQQQRDAERQTKANAEANQRAEQAVQRKAATDQLQTQQREVESKKRECTANVIARAKCAAQGYNPMTGMK